MADDTHSRNAQIRQIGNFLEGLQAEEVKEIFDLLARRRSKRLSLLPTLILPTYDGRALLLEYLPIVENYSVREIEFPLTDDINIFPVTQDKFLASGHYNEEEEEKKKGDINFMYDLTKDLVNYFKLQDFTIRGPSENKQVFFAYNRNKTAIVLIKFNIKDPKFKILKDKIPQPFPNINRNNKIPIRQLSENWLVINSHNLNLYYRESRNSAYKLKEKLKIEGYFCPFEYLNYEIAVLFIFNNQYQLIILKSNGEIKFKSLGPASSPIGVYSQEKVLRCLGSNTIATIFGEHSNAQVVIQTFYQEGNRINTQYFKWPNLPVSLNDNYFVHVGFRFVEIWYRENLKENYQLQFTVPIDQDDLFCYVLKPSSKAKNEIVNYLKLMIPIAKDLISLAVEFF